MALLRVLFIPHFYNSPLSSSVFCVRSPPVSDAVPHDDQSGLVVVDMQVEVQVQAFVQHLSGLRCSLDLTGPTSPIAAKRSPNVGTRAGPFPFIHLRLLDTNNKPLNPTAHSVNPLEPLLY